jgi:hypothetical protein
VYQNKVDELLRKNELEIGKLYRAFTAPTSQHLGFAQVQELVNTAKLNIKSRQLNICLVWS